MTQTPEESILLKSDLKSTKLSYVLGMLRTHAHVLAVGRLVFTDPASTKLTVMESLTIKSAPRTEIQECSQQIQQN